MKRFLILLLCISLLLSGCGWMQGSYVSVVPYDQQQEDYHYGMEYDAELWLLEDMSFAVVHCFRTMMEKHGHLGALTEYRIVRDNIENSEDLFFSIEELLEELDCICSLAESYKE